MDTGYEAEGEVAVVTKLCEQGYKVIACVKEENSHYAVRLRQSIPSESLLIHGMDIESERSINKCIREVGSKLKGIGVICALLIFNAKLQMRNVDDEAIGNHIDRLVCKHVIGLGHLIKRCLPFLRTSKGRIISVTSPADEEGRGKQFEEEIRGSALRTFVQVVRRELKLLTVAGINIELSYPLRYCHQPEHNVTSLHHSSGMGESQQQGKQKTDHWIRREGNDGAFKAFICSLGQAMNAPFPELTYRVM